MTQTHDSAWPQDLLEREIVITRVIDAPLALVYEAWVNPAHLPQWFGPAGFTVTTKEIDIRVGGRWRFDMVGPDGTCYDNRMVFKCIEPGVCLEAEHGRDIDDDPDRFHMRVSFAAQANGKTVVMLRQIHPSRAHRDRGIGFGAVEYGYQTLDKLAGFVGAQR